MEMKRTLNIRSLFQTRFDGNCMLRTTNRLNSKRRIKPNIVYAESNELQCNSRQATNSSAPRQGIMQQKRDQTRGVAQEYTVTNTNYNKFWTMPLLNWMVVLSYVTNFQSNTYAHEQCRIRFNCLFLNSGNETGLSILFGGPGPLPRQHKVLTATAS